jgi:four helix bundle protein
MAGVDVALILAGGLFRPKSKDPVMKNESIIARKSFTFALKAVALGRVLIQERSEYILSKQFIRSATGIGANVEEALGGHSRADFHAKMTIAYKEARETAYWIRLLKESGYFSETEAEPLADGIDELLRIIGSIQISTKAGIHPTSHPTRNS